MQLLPYTEFASLRLKPFCPNDDLYDENLDEHGAFIKEEIRGASFARWRKRPDDLFAIGIDLNDCSTDVAPLVFPKLGLSLEVGLSRVETDARLGTPDWQREDGRFVIYHTDGVSPYEVSCGFNDSLRLYQVSVRRLDIEIPDDE